MNHSGMGSYVLKNNVARQRKPKRNHSLQFLALGRIGAAIQKCIVRWSKLCKRVVFHLTFS